MFNYKKGFFPRLKSVGLLASKFSPTELRDQSMAQISSTTKIALIHKMLVALFLLTGLSITSAQPAANGIPFNAYILQAVHYIEANYSAMGYGQNAYTHDLPYGNTIIKASHPPETMCVAAVAEVIITALNIYMHQTGDKTPLDYLPPEGWQRLRITDIKSHIWVDPRLRSDGTADALSTFGIGRHAKFSDLTPGSFINLNRDNGTGHAVVFISFIDADGKDVNTYSSLVAGFKYFSSQGKHGAAGSGFGYRYAFFDKNGVPFCPNLPLGMKRDCGVQIPKNYKVLNSGYMIMPSQWDKAYREQSLNKLVKKLYSQDYSRAPAIFPTIHAKDETDFISQLKETDTMRVNPRYLLEDL
jgi:hypothetical protein